MRTSPIAAALLALAPCAAMADKLGDHPAIVVQRLHATQGYDYASKFYPHPAWLYLYTDEAGLMAKRQQQEREQQEHRVAQKPSPTTLARR